MKSVYIHIPFCKNICSYCDFCKVFYSSDWVNQYLDMLEKEIKLIYKNEKIRTLYIGGGTPSALNINELIRLFTIIKELDISSLEEFTIECNIEDINKEKLSLFKKNDVNRISIGIQTFNPEFLTFLQRRHTTADVINVVKLIKEVGFTNVNVDLMFGFKRQNIKSLKEDLSSFLQLDIPHISVYSLMIEENTKLAIDKTIEIDDDLNSKMYELINKTLKSNNYFHYEISNYAKAGYEAKHNLVYWNNEEYYGFGLGAASFIKDKRGENTRSLTKYLAGNYIHQEHYLSKKEMMQNEMILGLRKTRGVDKKSFFNKYQCFIGDVFDIKDLINNKYLIEDENKIYIPEEKLFLSNEILINFIE
jgi:oxygen-independent coproporphyrinogen III oxidase